MKNISFFFIALAFPIFINGQVALISSFDGIDYASHVGYNNNIVFKYKNPSNKYQLAILSGSSLKKVTNPDAGLGYTNMPYVALNNFFFRYTNASSVVKLAKFDGSSISLITCSRTGDVKDYFVSSFNDKLYGVFYPTGESTSLFAYNGDSVHVLRNPVPKSSVAGNGVIVFKDSLYFNYLGPSPSFKSLLAKYNGDTVSLLTNPDNGMGIENGTPYIIYKDNLYFVYRNAASNDQIAKFDGKTITLIPNPDGGMGIDINPTYHDVYVVYKDVMYFKYMSSAGEKIVKCDGSSTTFLTNPDGGEVQGNFIIKTNDYFYTDYLDASSYPQLLRCDGTSLVMAAKLTELTDNTSYHYYLSKEQPLVWNNNIYYRYKTSTGKLQMGKYNGSAANLIANPDTGIGYVDNLVSYNNKLYLNYQNKQKKNQLVEFDGITLSLIANPDTGKGVIGNLFEYNNFLFLQYQNKSAKYQLARLAGYSPSVQSSGIAVSAITSSAATVKVTKGNGAARVIFVSQASTGNASNPKDTNIYNANAEFSKGSSLSGDNSSTWYCVYNGSDSVVTISGLSSNTTYRVMAFEYNGYSGAEMYFSGSGSGNPVNFTTAVSAMEQNSEIAFEIYPNPATDVLNINSAGSVILSIQIFDLNGAMVYESKTNNTEINIQQMQQGFYVLKINEQYYKLIKQ